MKKAWLIFGMAIGLVACGDDAVTIEAPDGAAAQEGALQTTGARRNMIWEAEAGMLDSTKSFSKAAAQQLLLDAVNFANDFPDDKDAAPFLMIAVRASKSLDDPRVTIEYLDRLIREYPEYEDHALCYYLKAFTYDYDLEDITFSRMAYEEYIAAYPKHMYADQARARLESLGMDDLEMVKMFQKNQEAAGDSFGI